MVNFVLPQINTFLGLSRYLSTMNYGFRLVFAGLCCAIAVPCHAAGVTAGSLIESTATASFDSAGGRSTVTSNRISLTVDEVIDAALASVDSGAIPLTGASAVLAFSLVNTGNGQETFRLTTGAVAGSDFDPVVSNLAIDSNNNGIFDEGIDPIIPAGGVTPEIAPDARLTVFVIAGRNGTPTDGQQGQVSLLAESVTGTGTPGTLVPGQGSGGVDALIGTSGGRAQATGTLIVQTATVTITKTAAVSDPFGGSNPVPGAFVTMTLNTQVLGTGTTSNLVVSNPIPPGTRYVPSSLTVDGTALSDANDNDPGIASNEGIEVALSNLAGGTTRIISFRIQIE